MNDKTPPLVVILIMLLLSSCSFSSFEKPVDAEKSEFYYYTATKSDVVYKYRESFTGIKLWWKRIELNADAKSFVVLNKYYAKDKDYGYYRGDKFDADAESLELIAGGFCKDKNNIYYLGVKVTNVDFATFTTGKDFMRDKNHLFRNRFSDKEKGILEIVEGANPDTYEKIGNNWAKDDSFYYYFEEKVDVNYNTFRFLDRDVGIDKDHIYYFAGKPSYGHGKTYKHTGEVHYIARGVFYDKRNIYNFRTRPVFAETIRNSETLQVVDTTKNVVFFVDNTLYWNMKKRDTSHINIETFKTDGDFAMDKNRVYHNGFEIEGADKSTFERIHETFSKDAKYVYNKKEIFSGADPATFRYVSVEKGKSYYQDKNYKWKYNTKKGLWETFN